MDLSTLMPQQLQVVKTLDRPLFVSAGAGSGKTFTLTRRIVYALSPESGPFVEHLDQVLAITFTKDAAAEIRDRVRRALIDEGMDEEALTVDDAWISTIHGMCSRILRAHALELGIDPEFTVLTDTDELMDQAVEHVLARATAPDAAPELAASLKSLYAWYPMAGEGGQQGVIVGAALESMFMGAIMVGAAVPPEVYASGVLGCAFAVITGTGTATAVALALPVSVFLQVWRNFCYAVPGAFACKKIETALANRDLAKANLYHLTIVPLSIGIPSALLVFGSLFFGADLINNALNAIPQFVMDGLNVASGVMVCIGFALLIRTMGDNKLLPWLFIGFIMVIYLKMDVVGVAAAAICVALLLAFREGSSGPQAVAADEEEDF